MRLAVLILSTLWLAATPATARSATRFQPLAKPAGSTYCTAYGVSADGSTAVGWCNGPEGVWHAVRWSSDGSLFVLDDLPGGDVYAHATSASADGTTIVGYSRSDRGREAFRWTAAEGMVALGDLPGGEFDSGAHGVSHDGTTIVGWGTSEAGIEMFRWTASEGMVGLGDLEGGTFRSAASSVSPDGRVIVGSGETEAGQEAVRWTAEAGMVGLGVLREGSTATEVSADGSTVVGWNYDEFGSEAFLWTESAGMTGLGGPSAIAMSVSAHGAIVTGSALIWDVDHGFRAIATALSERGVGLGGFSGLTGSFAISADGSTIVGVGQRNNQPHGWLAVIPACDNGVDDDGDGVRDAADPGCADADDLDEHAPAFPCDDGIDGDADGLIDYPRDPGCANGYGRREDPQCQNGMDDDGDGAIDHPDDSECRSPSDDDELADRRGCGVGAELAIILAALRGARALERRTR